MWFWRRYGLFVLIWFSITQCLQGERAPADNLTSGITYFTKQFAWFVLDSVNIASQHCVQGRSLKSVPVSIQPSDGLLMFQQTIVLSVSWQTSCTITNCILIIIIVKIIIFIIILSMLKLGKLISVINNKRSVLLLS